VFGQNVLYGLERQSSCQISIADYQGKGQGSSCPDIGNNQLLRLLFNASATCTEQQLFLKIRARILTQNQALSSHACLVLLQNTCTGLISWTTAALCRLKQLMPPATNLPGIFGIYGVAVPYGASFVSAYIRTLIDECSHYYPDDGSRSSSHHNGKSS